MAAWNAAIYKPNPADLVWDPNCAELFSECDFKGQSIVLCEKVESFPSKGW